MKLEVGKKYVMRNGDVVTILDYQKNLNFPFITDLGPTYNEDGTYWSHIESHQDIISEYEEPHTPRYNTQPIDYTGCDPVIADHLKRGLAIECECGIVGYRDFITGYDIHATNCPYRGIRYTHEAATPIDYAPKPKTKKKIVKKFSEIVKWFEECGAIFYDDGSISDPSNSKHKWTPDMIVNCGKEPKPINRFDYFWHPDWLEEIEED